MPNLSVNRPRREAVLERERCQFLIDTARLRLRPFGLQDVEAVLSYATDPEWARYLPVPQPYLREHAEQFVASQVLLDRERHPTWAIEYVGVVNQVPIASRSLPW